MRCSESRASIPSTCCWPGRWARTCCTVCPTAASVASCRAPCSGCMSRRSSLPARWVRAMSATSRLPSSCTTCSISTIRPATSAVALHQLASSDSREFLSALGMHANELGRLYVVAYALLLFTWAESKELGIGLVLLASMGLVIAALVLTFSRGAFVGFVLVNLLFPLWRRNAKNLIFLGLLAAVALCALPDAVYDRIATGSGEGLNAISAGRIDLIWLPLLPELLRSPVYGSGLGSILWSDAMRSGAGTTILPVSHPHNAYLETLLDMGMAGLILVCAYFAHVWKGFRALGLDPSLSPTLRGFYLGAVAGLLGFLAASVTDGSLAPKPEQVFLWLAIGMMYGQRARKPAAREMRLKE